jgi:hypothetical protein
VRYIHEVENSARTDARHDLLPSLLEDSVVVRTANHAGTRPKQAEDQKQPSARAAAGDITALSHTALIREGKVARIVLICKADFHMNIRQPRLSMPKLDQLPQYFIVQILSFALREEKELLREVK